MVREWSRKLLSQALIVSLSISMFGLQPTAALAAASNAPDPNLLTFDGVDDEIVLQNLPVDLTPGAKTTVQFWMFWTGYPNNSPFSWTNSYSLIFAGNGQFGFNTGVGDVLGVSSAGLAMKWTHVTAVFTNGKPDPNSVELYLDGVKQTLTLSTPASPPTVRSVSNVAYISGRGYYNYKFKGQLKDVRLWNKALTQAEIAANMNTEVAGSAPGLAGNWRPDKFTTKKVYDLSPYGRIGDVRGVTQSWAMNPTLTPGRANVNVTWNGLTPPPDFYVLNRGATQVYKSTGLSHNDWGLLPDTSYDYTMYLRTAGGESAPITLGTVKTGAYTGSYQTFDGVDDSYVTSNLNVAAAAGAKNTVEFWMYLDGTTSAMPFAWDNGYGLQYTGTSLGFTTGNGDLLGASAAAYQNKWVHVGAVFPNGVPNAAGADLYLNGQKQALTQSGTAVSKTATPQASFSGLTGSNTLRLKGSLSQMSIWNTVRTASQIQADLNGGISGSEAGLIGHWRPDLFGTGRLYDMTAAKSDLVASGYASQLTNLQKTDVGTDQMTFTWDALADGPSAYVLTRNGTKVYEGTNTMFTDTGLTPATAYTYQLHAKNANGETKALSTTATTAVGAPAHFAGTADVQSNVLTWDAAPGATSYQLSRDGHVIYTGSDTTFTDSGLSPGASYHYSLVAIAPASTSQPVTLDLHTIPQAPADLQAVPGETGVTLSWQGGNDGVEYVVTRDGQMVYTGPLHVFTDTDLLPDTEHVYTVIARNQGGASQPATLTARTLLPVPMPPGDLTGTADVREATLSWNAVPYAATYEVKRDGQVVHTGTSTQFTDSGLTPATAYRYAVAALNNRGASDVAEIELTTQQLSAPAMPVNLSGDATETSARLVWDTVTDAEQYVVTRNGTTVYTGTVPSFTDSALSPNTVYEYEVLAVNAGGSSAVAALTLRTALPAPAAPGHLSATSTETDIHLTWSASGYADAYELKRNGETIYEGGNLEFTDSGLTQGTSYEYELTAKNASGTSAPSTLSAATKQPAQPDPVDPQDPADPVDPQDPPTDVQQPAAPDGLHGEPTAKSIQLTWTPVDNATGYIVKRDGATIYEGTDASFNDFGLSALTTYSYEVFAVRDGLTSPAAMLSVTTTAPRPTQSRPPSLARSVVTATPDALEANGTSTSEIKVQIKDVIGGNVTTSVGTVTMSTTLGTLSDVTDNGDGTYTAVLTAAATAGTAEVTAQLNGLAIPNRATVSMNSTMLPAPNLLPSTTDWTQEPVTFTVEGDTGIGNGTKLQYKIGDNGAWQDYSDMVTVAKEGIIPVSARVADQQGNTSEAVSVTLRIDRTPPRVTLNGSKSVSVKKGVMFDDPSATVTDNLDPEITVSVEGSVRINKAGTYKLTYTATDRAGNVSNAVSRTVKVTSMTTPKPASTATPAPIGPSVLFNGIKTTDSATMEKATAESPTRIRLLADKFTARLELAKQQDPAHPVVTIQVPEWKDGAQIDLPADVLKKYQTLTPDLLLRVEVPSASYELPLAALDFNELSRQVGTMEAGSTIGVRIQNRNGTLLQEVQTQAAQQGAVVRSNIVQFDVIAAAGGKQAVIGSFGDRYIKRTVYLAQPLSSAQATAAMYDPATHQFSFVPAIFQPENGRHSVVMQGTGNSIYVVLETRRGFADLDGHWAKADIEDLASKLLVKGQTATQFAPDQAVTRAQFTAMLVRALGLPEQANARPNFTDVPPAEWYAGTVQTATDAGLVSGFSDGAFRPNDLITREQMAVLIQKGIAFTGGRTEQLSHDALLASFQDRAAIQPWAQAAVAQAYAVGIIHGTTPSTFAPERAATRAEACVMLKRMLHYLGFTN